MLKALTLVLDGRSLSREHARAVMEELVGGAVAPEQAGALLAGLRIKGESVDELLGFLDCLRERAVPVPHDRNDLIDVCGTGGDGTGTFNVSTAVAFTVAGAGQPVAKHGNRSVSSRSGSFDVLEAMGLKLEANPQVAARAIERHGLGLLFAPAFHPALKVVAPLRKSLGVYTVFNALGPLLNPARVKRQLIGVYRPELLMKTAQVLLDSGAHEAMVVHGEDGLDELSLGAPSRVAHLKDGRITEYTVRAEELGLTPAPLSALKGAGPQENAAILRSVLGGAKGPARDIVVLNAAAALLVGGKAPTLRDGVERAAHALDSGRAAAVLEALRAEGAR
jgi:anthranilate phosphoribosyltransferase